MMIFLGLLFLFLDINVGTVNLLPSFVGYMFVAAGMKERGSELPSYGTSQMITVAAAVASGLIWIMAIFGVSIPVIGVVLQLLVTYRLVLWAEELVGETPDTAWFRKSWYVLLCGLLATMVFGLLGSGLALLGLLAALGGIIMYIYGYYRIWKGLERA